MWSLIKNEEKKVIKIVTQTPVSEVKALEFRKGFFWEGHYTDLVQWESIETSANSSLNTVLKVALFDFSYSTQIMLL